MKSTHKYLLILALLLGLSCSKAPTTEAAEIVQIATAAADIITVIVETENPPEDPPSQDAALWTIDGSPAVEVGRWSYPWYEGIPENGVFPLTIRHHMYLKLNSNLVQGQAYQIGTPFGTQQFTFDDHQTWCESIKVNQASYSGRGAYRFANLGIFPAELGPVLLDEEPTYQVIEESSGAVVHSGQADYWGDDTDGDRNSGEYVYRLDLAPVEPGGPYFVVVDGFGRSHSFGIGGEFSREVDYVHTRGLYHQRCGIALEQPYTQFTRGACHTTVEVTDAEPPGFIDEHGPPMEIHGGYHDAGDFDRRLSHTLIPAWMLNTYEMFPDRFSDNQYNIPESGDGVPDWLNEALWGILVWAYLQEDDGAVRGGTEANQHPTYAQVNAETDNLTYRTYRRYGHTTASGAGLFAHASRLLEPFDPDSAAVLLDRAVNAWNFMQQHDMPTANSAQTMYAALQLYLATGEDQYHNVFLAEADYLINDANWPEQYHPTYWNLNLIRDGMIFGPYFFGYLITDLPTNSAIRSGLFDMLEPAADISLSYLAGNPYPVGPAPNVAWGSITNQGRYAEPMMMMYRLTGNTQYRDAISLLGDYSLGLNPISKSYVVGLGENPPQNPLHLDSYYTHEAGLGNVPGIVIYGPSAGTSGQPYQQVVWEKLYPPWNLMPEQRRYCDGWSLINCNEFTTWETIALNACMYAFLSEPEDDPVQVEPDQGEIPAEKSDWIQNYPNPFETMTQIQFRTPRAGDVTVAIFSSDGKLVNTLLEQDLAAGTHEVTWNARDESGNAVAAGTYLCRVTGADYEHVNKITLLK